MALIIDFLLLAASGAACFYCWILSTRIKALTSTENGIHSGIAALSQSAEDIQNAMSSAKTDAAEKSESLEALLTEADKKIPEIRELLQQINELSERSVDQVESATKNLINTLAPHIEEARKVSHHLLDSLESAYEQETAEEIAPSTPSAPSAPSAPNDDDDPSASEESVDMEISVVLDDEDQINKGEAA
jgi:ABC-type transporter Mla subunit MlaD